MKLNREQLLFLLNLLSLTTLFVGYILTTGLQIVDPDSTKNFFRFFAAGTAVVAIAAGGRLTWGFCALIYVFIMTLVTSGNSVNLNLIFLVIAVQALTVLTARRASIVLFLRPQRAFLSIFSHAALALQQPPQPISAVACDRRPGLRMRTRPL